MSDRSRPCLPRARHWIRLAIGFGAGHVVVTACDYSQYPIEASFCDEWCRVLRRTPCDQEPENCVRDCESALPSAACMDRQVTLLDCYRATPPDQLVCVDQGFQDEVRPRPEICTIERDALIACEAPRVMSCIEACRELDAADPVVATSPVSAELCPESPLPCERLCWELDRFAASGVFGSPPLAAANDDAALVELGEPFIACARGEARGCQARADLGLEFARVTWTSAFLECAGVSAELDLFD